MDKKQLKIALAVLDAVRSTFPETNKFIDSTLKEECEKEKITADKVFFLLLNLQKKISLDKHFCFRFGTIMIIFFVYRCGNVWQIVKRQNVHQKKR